jgi:hypothetical protein
MSSRMRRPREAGRRHRGLVEGQLRSAARARLESGTRGRLRRSAKRPRVFSWSRCTSATYSAERCAIASSTLRPRLHHAARVDHVDDRPVVLRRDLHRRVLLAGGGPADQQRQVNWRAPSRLATWTISSSDGVMRPRQADHVHLLACARVAGSSRPAPSRPGRRPRSCCSRAPRRRCSCRCRGRRPSRWPAGSCRAACLPAAGLLGLHERLEVGHGRFITRALLTTCGRNILPAPKRSPTTASCRPSAAPR